MKKNKNKKALDILLGFENATEADEAEREALQAFQKMKAPVENRSADLEAAWEKIEKGIDRIDAKKRKTTTSDKMIKRRGRLLQLKILGPAIAAAAAVVIIMVTLPGGAEPITLKIADKKVDLQKSYNSPAHVTRGQVSNALQLSLRDVKAMTATRSKGHTAFALDSGSLLVKFDSTHHDAATSVSFKTPRAHYRITGTHFLLQSDPGAGIDTLIVFEGEVIVTYQKVKQKVSTRQRWASIKSEIIKISEGFEKTIQERFTQKKAGLIDLTVKKTSVKPAPVSKPQYRIKATDGTVFQGSIIKKTATSVTLKTDLGPVQIKREKILSSVPPID